MIAKEISSFMVCPCKSVRQKEKQLSYLNIKIKHTRTTDVVARAQRDRYSLTFNKLSDSAYGWLMCLSMLQRCKMMK